MLYVSYHSSSQVILYPDSPDQVGPEIHSLGGRAIKAMEATNGGNRKYNLGPATATLGYSSPGNSMDWASEKARILYSYTIELPPERYADGSDMECKRFKLPKNEILDVGREQHAGLVALISHFLQA